MYTVNKVTHAKLHRKHSLPDLEIVFIDASFDCVSLKKQNLMDHLIFSVTIINEML